MWIFGVAVNGVPFDPSGPFWNRDGNSGWQFEVLCPANAVALGIDVNRRTRRAGGCITTMACRPDCSGTLRGRAPDRPMHLLGYAADGFPIYGPEGPSDPDDLESPPAPAPLELPAPAGQARRRPGGRFDGTFVEDFDTCPVSATSTSATAAPGRRPSIPDGTYYYVLTDEFPFIPRRYRGTPDTSFRHGPPPGVSPPVPPQLRQYHGEG